MLSKSIAIDFSGLDDKVHDHRRIDPFVSQHAFDYLQSLLEQRVFGCMSQVIEQGVDQSARHAVFATNREAMAHDVGSDRRRQVRDTCSLNILCCQIHYNIRRHRHFFLIHAGHSK